MKVLALLCLLFASALAQTEHEFKWAIVGSPKFFQSHSTGNKNPECLNTKSRKSAASNLWGDAIGVTCCSDNGIGSRPGCIEGVSWYSAKNHCEQEGMRLCTMMEIHRGAGADTGCDFDGYLVWTETECDDICQITPCQSGDGKKCAPHTTWRDCKAKSGTFKTIHLHQDEKQSIVRVPANAQNLRVNLNSAGDFDLQVNADYSVCLTGYDCAHQINGMQHMFGMDIYYSGDDHKIPVAEKLSIDGTITQPLTLIASAYAGGSAIIKWSYDAIDPCIPGWEVTRTCDGEGPLQMAQPQLPFTQTEESHSDTQQKEILKFGFVFIVGSIVGCLCYTILSYACGKRKQDEDVKLERFI